MPISFRRFRIESDSSAFCMAVDSVISRSSSVGGKPVSARIRSTVADQLAILELPRREVHRHAQPRMPGVVPRLHLRAGGAQHPRADGHDELRLLGDGDEVLRLDQSRSPDGSSAPAPRRRRRCPVAISTIGW